VTGDAESDPVTVIIEVPPRPVSPLDLPAAGARLPDLIINDPALLTAMRNSEAAVDALVKCLV